jgi:hypothetical protein
MIRKALNSIVFQCTFQLVSTGKLVKGQSQQGYYLNFGSLIIIFCMTVKFSSCFVSQVLRNVLKFYNMHPRTPFLFLVTDFTKSR